MGNRIMITYEFVGIRRKPFTFFSFRVFRVFRGKYLILSSGLAHPSMRNIL
jgi:hypothetical protein